METLYRKVGRKYVPVSINWTYDRDSMRVGTFRLQYAYGEGGRMFEYDVAPDTAGFVAAAMMARKAMEDAMKEAAAMKPNEDKSRPYTKKQQALIKQFKADMGGMMPTWWIGQTPWAIAEAGINAVKNYRP